MTLYFACGSEALEQVQIEIAGARLLLFDDDLSGKEFRPAGFLFGDQLVDVRFLVAVRFSDFGDVLVERAHCHGAGCAEVDGIGGHRGPRGEIEQAARKHDQQQPGHSFVLFGD